MEDIVGYRPDPLRLDKVFNAHPNMNTTLWLTFYVPKDTKLIYPFQYIEYNIPKMIKILESEYGWNPPSKELTKEVDFAIKWLAAEFSFLKKFSSDLERIDKEFESDPKRKYDYEGKELQKDVTVLRYISRAEKQVERDVEAVVKTIKKQRGETTSIANVNKLLSEIEVPAHQLLLNGSRYVGQLRKQLESICTTVQINQKYPKEETRALVQKEIEGLDSEVHHLMVWIAGLDAALKKASAVVEFDQEQLVEDMINGKIQRNWFCLRKVYRNPKIIEFANKIEKEEGGFWKSYEAGGAAGMYHSEIAHLLDLVQNFIKSGILIDLGCGDHIEQMWRFAHVAEVEDLILVDLYAVGDVLDLKVGLDHKAKVVNQVDFEYRLGKINV